MKNTKKVERSLKNLKEVSTLKKVKLNCNYFTYNYDLIKPREGNRAGLENKRVKFYDKCIQQETFNFNYCLIQVDKDGDLGDGTHRFEALKKNNLPIRFTVVDKIDLNEISEYNSGMNSKWTPEGSFGSAFTGGSKVASNLSEMRDKLLQKYNLIVKKISAPEMYGILVKNTKYFSSGLNAPTRRMYFDKKLVSKSNGKEFKKTLDLYASMKKELKSNRDAYKVCKVVMDLHFNVQVAFDLSTFCDILNDQGFVLPKTAPYNVPNIKAKVLAMYKKQIKIAA